MLGGRLPRRLKQSKDDNKNIVDQSIIDTVEIKEPNMPSEPIVITFAAFFTCITFVYGNCIIFLVNKFS